MKGGMNRQQAATDRRRLHEFISMRINTVAAMATNNITTKSSSSSNNNIKKTTTTTTTTTTATTTTTTTTHDDDTMATAVAAATSTTATPTEHDAPDWMSVVGQSLAAVVVLLVVETLHTATAHTNPTE